MWEKFNQQSSKVKWLVSTDESVCNSVSGHLLTTVKTAYKESLEMTSGFKWGLYTQGVLSVL